MVMRSGIDCVLFCFRCTCLSPTSSTDKPHMNQAIEELGRTAIDLALSQWGIAIDESLAACAYMASKLNDFDTGNLDAGLGVPLSLVLRDESTRGLSAGVSGGWDVFRYMV